MSVKGKPFSSFDWKRILLLTSSGPPFDGADGGAVHDKLLCGGVIGRGGLQTSDERPYWIACEKNKHEKNKHKSSATIRQIHEYTQKHWTNVWVSDCRYECTAYNLFKIIIIRDNSLTLQPLFGGATDLIKQLCSLVDSWQPWPKCMSYERYPKWMQREQQCGSPVFEALKGQICICHG